MKILRHFEYLIPRICILLLLCTAIWISKDPLLKGFIVQQTQQIAGAKVEIQHLSSNWEDGKLFLKNLKVADAENPMSNLMQADLAYLKFNLATLKHRRLEIEEGRLIGLVLNAPRTESGALNSASSTGSTGTTVAANNAAVLSAPLTDRTGLKNRKTSDQIGKHWINQLPPGNIYSSADRGSVPVQNFQSAFKQIQNQFNQQLTAFSQRIDSLAPQLQTVSAELSKERFPNPLRDQDTWGKSIELLDQWQAQADHIRQQLSQESKKLEQHRNSIKEIADQESHRIDEISFSHPFRAETVNQLLLSNEQHRLIEEIMDSIIHIRSSLSKGAELTAATNDSQRLDKTFRFPRLTYQPQILIKKLDLEGSGRFADRRMNFVGTAHNLTSHPEWTAEPTHVELRALGKQNLMLSYSRQNQSANSRESIEIQWPDFNLPETEMGHDQSMLAAISPGRQVTAKIVLQIQDNQVQGQIQLHHSNVALHLDHLHELLGGNEIRLRLNQGLSQINQFQSRATISGSLLDYQVTLHSDLGNQFEQLADKLLTERGELQKQQQKDQLAQAAQGATRQIQEQWHPQLNALLLRLDQDLTRISELKSSLDSAQRDGWSKIR
jgi:uncharacterized protein (TIGR03545 family)